MKQALHVLFVLFATIPAAAQYGPPARDLRDAVKMLQEMQRLIEPAITAMRDNAAVLATLAKAEKQLKDAQPKTSFDEADKTIDEFLVRRKNVDALLPRELGRTVAEAQRIVNEGRTLNNVAVAREKLHHDVVHPLQRQVVRDIEQWHQLTQQLQYMAQRATMPALSEALNASGYASTDPR